MTGTTYRPRGSGYTVSGTSALAPPRYYEDESRPPAYELRIVGRPPQARRRQERQRGISASIMLVSLGLLFAILAVVSIGKSAASSGVQRMIAEAESSVKTLRDENQVLERSLMSNTDGEQIRHYVVSQLGLLRIQAGNIQPVHMPNTRPMGEAPPSVVQMRQVEGGFFAMLAQLLQKIPF
ncbi:MAG: hypothetical protein FWD25_04085 [Clostridia bacterium]|nr:hypothetical protein [Clostridia bacterium]